VALQVEPAHAGHLDVGDQAGRRAAGRRGQEFLGGGEGGDSEVERRQQVAERGTHGLVVVDDGDGRRF
jgi:hypothetical protein